MKLKNKFATAAAASLLLLAGSIGAATVTQNLGPLTSTTVAGTLASQADVYEFNFSLASTSSLLASTTSYGGGKNLDGTTASAGGFQPNLTLYDGAGNYEASSLANNPNANTDSATGAALDPWLKASNLAPGNYILTLTDFQVQQPITATNLSDGFVDMGNPGMFTDVQGNTRNGSFALNIMASSSSPSTVPEPGSFWLALAGLFGAAAFVLRKRRATV